MNIYPGHVVTEGTIWGDREIEVTTTPNKQGNYEGVILSGPDAGPYVYCFSSMQARAVRPLEPGEGQRAVLVA